MTYQEALDWMYGRLPMYQRKGAPAFRYNLNNIELLVGQLGDPHKTFKSIHVGGTNGKGSTTNMLASIFQEAGYKTGLYTSPHLKDFRERIRINGEMVSEAFVVDFITEQQAFLEEQNLSFFELTVGMAFYAFAQAKVDIAIIEVGLGGRLDATNIIIPQVSVITNIGLDHMHILGNTLKEIAGEKAGIIKPGIPVVIGEKDSDTASVFVAQAALKGCAISFASEENHPAYSTDLKGNYQKMNVQTVLETIRVIQSKGIYLLPESAIKSGLNNVVANTGLQGRWQVLQEKPKVICDTAHNKPGLELALSQLLEEDFDQLHIVMGVVSDKDIEAILPLFPKKAHYYFCKPDVPRGLNAQVLQETASRFKLSGGVYSSVNEAYMSAIKEASINDVIYVGGSTFVVAEII